MRIIPKLCRQYLLQFNFKSGKAIRIWATNWTIETGSGPISSVEYGWQKQKLLAYDLNEVEAIIEVRRGKWRLSWRD